MARYWFLPPRFVLAMIATVVAASEVPCRGTAALAVDRLIDVVIALLFFLHGAKLPRAAVIAAARHWRLHAVVLLTTFALFPLGGLILEPILSPLTTPALYVGILFLCTLPSTIQASIAFTAIAKGNVPAAVFSASASSFIGIFATPLLTRIVLSAHGGSASADEIREITLQLLVPFVCGQLLRPLIRGWLDRHDSTATAVDQGSLLLIVYSAFSAAVSEGLWHQVSLSALAGLIAADGILLAVVLSATGIVSQWLRFEPADRVTIIFCGSKKSLSQGVVMAKVMFAAHGLGTAMLPLMVFHQIQMMVCAVLADRWGRRATLSLPVPADAGRVVHR